VALFGPRNACLSCRPPHHHRSTSCGGPVALTLVDVRDLAFPASDPQQSFSILFRGPAAELLPQDTYRMRHYRIGSHMLFIVPRPSDRHPAAYEAVFNRLPA
jgi:hypothetical protein